MKNSNTLPENKPQWDKILFENELIEVTSKEWFRKVYEFWEKNQIENKWIKVPSFQEVKALYEKEGEVFPIVSKGIVKYSWAKLYNDTSFRIRRTLLGYADSQSQLDPKYVKSFYASLKNEIDERLSDLFDSWKMIESRHEIWNNFVEEEWHESFKKQITEQLYEDIHTIADEQKREIVKEGSKSVYSFFYECFLTETIVEEHYNHHGGYYDNQRYTYIDTGEPYTFKNTPNVSDFNKRYTGDYDYPKYLCDSMENEFNNSCITKLIEFVVERKSACQMGHLDDKQARLIVGDAISYMDFYETTNNWYWEEESEWAKLTSLDMLCQAERVVIGLSEDLKNQFRQLLIEHEQDELWKKELFEKEYKTLFSQQRTHKTYTIHTGPTNSGKTYSAIQKLKKATTGCYLGPLRLLAYEVREALSNEGVHCSIVTGEDNQVSPRDTHVSSTVEMLSNEVPYDVLVIDECQMIADKDRGFAWVRAILDNHARDVHVICAEHALDILKELLKGQNVDIIYYERQTPLVVDNTPVDISNLEEEVQKGDACIVFSKKKALATVAMLEEKGIHSSVIYGAMPPEVRLKQVEQFIKGETKVVVSTDAIGMGLNLPIRRVLFLEIEKFDGQSVRPLNSQEIKQIGGRAGRKGIYDEGYILFPKDVKKNREKLEKVDELISQIVIQPTRNLWNKFQEKSNNMARFFQLWSAFEIEDKRVKKKQLDIEMDRLKMVCNCPGYEEFLEKKGMHTLYRLLSLPFHSDNSTLNEHYLKWTKQIFLGKPLSSPLINKNSKNIATLEQDYSLISLFLLMKYANGEKDMYIWEEKRYDLAMNMDDLLKAGKTNHHRMCKYCNQKMEWHALFNICDKCYRKNKKSNYRNSEWHDEKW